MLPLNLADFFASRESGCGTWQTRACAVPCPHLKKADFAPPAHPQSTHRKLIRAPDGEHALAVIVMASACPRLRLQTAYAVMNDCLRPFPPRARVRETFPTRDRGPCLHPRVIAQKTGPTAILGGAPQFLRRGRENERTPCAGDYVLHTQQ